MTDMDVAYWMAKYDKLKEDYADLNCHYAAALDKINELEDRWIAVDDRLPEETGRYLVYVENIANYHHLPQNTILADWFFKSWNFTGWEYNKVTHWMPLPKKPKIEE